MQLDSLTRLNSSLFAGVFRPLQVDILTQRDRAKPWQQRMVSTPTRESFNGPIVSCYIFSPSIWGAFIYMQLTRDFLVHKSCVLVQLAGSQSVPSVNVPHDAKVTLLDFPVLICVTAVYVLCRKIIRPSLIVANSSSLKSCGKTQWRLHAFHKSGDLWNACKRHFTRQLMTKRMY